MESNSIALDGPVGAGKSTLARMLAKHFGLIYVDTGALYRCIALFAQRKNIEANDSENITKLLPLINIEMKYGEDGIQRMLLCGEDVTDEIRSPEISMGASAVSAIPAVRTFLLSTQREMAKKYSVIMDGRDIGTVVLPNAGIKIFLTAKPESRAKRRFVELMSKNIDITYDEVLRDLLLRDKNDSERETAPLKAAEDAIILDTTNYELEKSFKVLCTIINGRLGS